MIQDQIRARIEQFTTELEGLVRRAALTAVAEALAGTTPSVTRNVQPRRPRGRPRKNAAAPATKSAGAKASASKGASAKAAAPKAAAPKAAAPKTKGKGSVDGGAVARYVAANPGARAEAIIKALGAPKERVKATLSELVEAKTIKKTGKTRGTQYFPV